MHQYCVEIYCILILYHYSIYKHTIAYIWFTPEKVNVALQHLSISIILATQKITYRMLFLFLADLFRVRSYGEWWCRWNEL